MYLYSYNKELRKNPQCSISCCLALLLPLNDLKSDIHGLSGTNVLNNQLDTGQMEMPSIGATLENSGAIDVVIEGGEEDDDDEAIEAHA